MAEEIDWVSMETPHKAGTGSPRPSPRQPRGSTPDPHRPPRFLAVIRDKSTKAILSSRG